LVCAANWIGAPETAIKLRPKKVSSNLDFIVPPVVNLVVGLAHVDMVGGRFALSAFRLAVTSGNASPRLKPRINNKELVSIDSICASTYIGAGSVENLSWESCGN
jgi:hypothetical protein